MIASLSSDQRNPIVDRGKGKQREKKVRKKENDT